MDTTKEYIKMCEKATEIQELWKPTNGDVCWHDNEGAYFEGFWEFPSETRIIHISKEKPKDWWYHWLWLLRQDQLQEMLGYWITTLMVFFERWCKESKPIHPTAGLQLGLTYEQLWLAFVMKEKYGKTWNGEDWLKV